MTDLTRCDKCGAESERGEFYGVHRHPHDQPVMEQGDFCPDCFPRELLEHINREDLDYE